MIRAPAGAERNSRSAVEPRKEWNCTARFARGTEDAETEESFLTLKKSEKNKQLNSFYLCELCASAVKNFRNEWVR